MTQQFRSLDIYPRVIKSYAHTETYSRMFIAVLFIIPKNWQQTNCNFFKKTAPCNNVVESLKQHVECEKKECKGVPTT